MKKEKYERAEVEVIGFDTDDVIATSDRIAYESDEIPLMK